MTYSIEIIRDVNQDLVQALNGLMPQLNPAHPSPTPEQLDAILSGGATELFAAREAASASIVGVLALVVFSTPSGTHAWIEDVVVDESWRGQGIGEALTRAALARAKERGASVVDLTSRPSRAAANSLYAKMGFELRQTNLYRYILPR